jgi:hypothetical protein
VSAISGKDIQEGVTVFVFKNLMGRNGAFNNLAEDAI